MSAIVCGKRSSSLFEELQYTPPPAKRSRCAAATTTTEAPPLARGFEREHLLERLRSQFPDMSDESLEKALEDSGYNLDSAIKSLLELHLEATEVNMSSTACESQSVLPAEVQITNEGSLNDTRASAPIVNGLGMENLPSDGSQWVELLVKEMANASNVDDARARASRVLEVLEKSVVSRVGAEPMQNFQKENVLLKGQLESLLRENTILKRAVAIQHERQKEYDERNQELQHVKQLVAQYQEQVRTLEVNNYALTMHLRQAQQSSSIPKHFHPDIF